MTNLLLLVPKSVFIKTVSTSIIKIRFHMTEVILPTTPASNTMAALTMVRPAIIQPKISPKPKLNTPKISLHQDILLCVILSHNEGKSLIQTQCVLLSMHSIAHDSCSEL